MDAVEGFVVVVGVVVGEGLTEYDVVFDVVVTGVVLGGLPDVVVLVEDEVYKDLIDGVVYHGLNGGVVLVEDVVDEGLTDGVELFVVVGVDDFDVTVYSGIPHSAHPRLIFLGLDVTVFVAVSVLVAISVEVVVSVTVAVLT